MCGFDGRFCRLLVKGIVSDEYYRRQVYRGLVVNPVYAIMYWIDVPGSFDSPKIMSAYMDGTNVSWRINYRAISPLFLSTDSVRDRFIREPVDALCLLFFRRRRKDETRRMGVVYRFISVGGAPVEKSVPPELIRQRFFFFLIKAYSRTAAVQSSIFFNLSLFCEWSGM